ncbi:M23 family metallopeptidase [Streptomyces litchfieldiae]|uniref:M23 family metallopeptidase n=1 Tax=Streptomyces litchfieldiae TaxID=3075543 RepID=A0ABU2MME0_9ACTN|nr:M23 family metallopeptidase [Streptomyces sp. DSM 44938]MDT0342772.1 M23 family metallopeptidase [Streptomyces sp. DSM 44938]
MSPVRKPAFLRRLPLRRQTPVHRAVGCTLLGTLVITGPWTVPAVGDDAAVSDRPGGRYGAPFLPPYPGPHPPLGGEPAAEKWTSPVNGHEISARYGTPGGWAAGYHTGVDFATPVGVPVAAVGPGRVVSAGRAGAYGNAVVVRMTDGYFALYAHLSEISVPEGERVDAGTELGATGNTGRSTGPHLHFEVRRGREYGTDVDPLAYLKRHGVRVS